MHQSIGTLSKVSDQHLKQARVFKTDFLHISYKTTMVKGGGSRAHFDLEVKAYEEFRGTLTPRQIHEGYTPFQHGDLTLIENWRGPSNAALKDWIKAVPEKQELAPGKWRCGLTDFTAIAVTSVWPSHQLMFDSEDTRNIFMGLVARFYNQDTVAKRTAEFKVNGVIPEMPADHIEHDKWPLLPHMRVACLNSLENKAYALFQDPGTCKTATTIARIMIESLRKREGRLLGTESRSIYRVLVVCPNEVRINWCREMVKFNTVPGKYTIIDGDYEQRVRQVLDGIRDEEDCYWSVCVVGWDSLMPSIEALRLAPWDLLVLDEAHFAKNHRTERWKAVTQLTRESNVRQTQLLTGTPIANSPCDLWAQWEMMEEGFSGFTAYASFSRFYGKYKVLKTDEGSSVSKLVGINNAPLLQERLARTSFIIKQEECIDLPPMTYDVIQVDMPTKQREIYEQVRDDLAVELEDTVNGEFKTLTANHVLKKLLRLAQITSGYIKWDEEVDFDGNITRPAYEEPFASNPKMNTLVETFREEWEANPAGKKIVWATFRHNLIGLKERFDREGIKSVLYFGDTSTEDRQRAVDDFNNDPDTKVFIGNPKSAGTGINLLGYEVGKPCRSFTDHVVFYSQNWSAIERVQAERRAYRMGTKVSVRVSDLVMPKTIDMEIMTAVQDKRDMADKLQDVRDILQKVLYE
jgi:SNF2 family DNA or RNA helicase